MKSRKAKWFELIVLSIFLALAGCAGSSYNKKLISSAEKGDIQSVKNELHANPDTPNRWLNKALISASWQGHTDIVKLLLDRGVDADGVKYRGQRTALYAATAGGHEETVKLLLDRGANPDPVIQGWGGDYSAIRLAWASGHNEIMNLLIEKGTKEKINRSSSRWGIWIENISNTYSISASSMLTNKVQKLTPKESNSVFSIIEVTVKDQKSKKGLSLNFKDIYLFDQDSEGTANLVAFGTSKSHFVLSTDSEIITSKYSSNSSANFETLFLVFLTKDESINNMLFKFKDVPPIKVSLITQTSEGE